jgi:hypothetical protein
MEKQLNKQIETYILQFKNNIRDKILALNLNEQFKANELMEFVYEYEKLEFDKDDVAKRKRNKNTVPDNNRCNARLANNDQCTRRRKENNEFCGTHVKSTPNGFITTCTDCKLVKTEVTAKDIAGIVYYIDDMNRVYNTEEVLANRENPTIVGYVKENTVIYV